MDREKSSQAYAGVSASVLKTVALVTMFIDHFAYMVVRTVEEQLFPDWGDKGAVSAFLRMIGRMAFIIYAFLLAEGLIRTRDRKKFFFKAAAGRRYFRDTF